MRTPTTPEERRAQALLANLTRHRGPDHPDTLAADRDLTKARLRATEAEADRLRALLAAWPGTAVA